MDFAQQVLLIIVVAVVLFIVTHLRPLSTEEIAQLATLRRLAQVGNYFDFYFGELGVNLEFKKRMESAGEFYGIRETLSALPSRVAGLLKYKKHEWVAVAFEKNKLVDMIWVNKGFDRHSAAIFLPATELSEIAHRGGYGSLLILHNHPNPNPNRYDCTKPSPTDLDTAQQYARALNPTGISLVKFICERGRPYRYFLSAADTLFPFRDFESAIRGVNGRSLLWNLRLHLERIFGRRPDFRSA